MRLEFSAKTKELAYRRSGGHCECCGVPLATGNIHYDHRIANALTGEPSLENCQCLCRACHAAKTRLDVAHIAKAKRRERRHIGIKRKPSRPLPGTRASGIRKRMDGTVERW